jgi:hypothetical protein
MDGAIDGKEGYEKTDHGPFLNMVSLLFPLGKSFIRKEETPDSPKQELPQKSMFNRSRVRLLAYCG